MAVDIISTSQIGPGILYSTPSSGSTFWLLSGVSYISTDSNPVVVNDASCSILIDGTLGGFSSLLISASSTRLVIGATGTVSGITGVGGGAIGVSEFAENTSIENFGAIRGNSVGLYSSGGTQITNYGTISGGANALMLGLFGLGGGSAPDDSEADRVINYGTISGGTSSLTTNFRYGHAIFVEGPGVQIQNFGTISAIATDRAGIGIGSDDFSTAGATVIDNHGTIVSAAGTGIDATFASGTGLTIRNSGLISGQDRSVTGSALADSLTNSGTLQGDVALGGGADRYDGRGGEVVGTIDSGDGDDTFLLGAGEDQVIGGIGIDTLDFRGGQAVQVALDGSFENAGAAQGDTYFQIENLYGSNAGDRLIGNTATNVLFGLNGVDTLDGGGGADRLRGGAGADVLTGGLGNDTFQFITRGDAGDVISDFFNVSGNNDRFQISSGFGGGLLLGTLDATAFQSRADNMAQDGDDRFIFRTTDRTLWFDEDGNGALAALMVADLQSGATLTAADILIF